MYIHFFFYDKERRTSADPLQSERQTSFVGHLLIQLLSFLSWVTCTSVLWLGAGRQHSELEINKKVHKTMSRNCTCSVVCFSCVHKPMHGVQCILLLTLEGSENTRWVQLGNLDLITFMKAVKRTHLRFAAFEDRETEVWWAEDQTCECTRKYLVFVLSRGCLLLNQPVEYKSLDLYFHSKHLF